MTYQSSNSFPEHDKILSGEIAVSSVDGLISAIKYYIPKTLAKNPVLILLHMIYKNITSWDNFIPLLLNNNYAVYNVDLRGHGRSTRMENGVEIFYENMNEMDYLKIPNDINSIINFISMNKQIDADKINIIGADIGANVPIIAASENPEKIKSIIAISPGLNYHGLDITKVATDFKTPILIVTSEDDKYSLECSNQLNKVVKASHNLLIYKGSEHGTDLVEKSEDFRKKAVDWLNEKNR